MLRKLLALDGVLVVVHFRDDGQLIEGFGMLDEADQHRLAHFAHDYRRMVQGNADQLSMFTQLRGWTPPRGWIVRGSTAAVCGCGNLVCLVMINDSNLTEVMREMADAASY